MGKNLKPLSFYLFQSKLYFNRQEEGIPHPDLWHKIVFREFAALSYETKIDLAQDCYGLERGRLVYLDAEKTWILYGTPGLAPYLDQIKKILKLEGVALKTDFKTDKHYKKNPLHSKNIEHAVRLLKSSGPLSQNIAEAIEL